MKQAYKLADDEVAAVVQSGRCPLCDDHMRTDHLMTNNVDFMWFGVCNKCGVQMDVMVRYQGPCYLQRAIPPALSASPGAKA